MSISINEQNNIFSPCDAASEGVPPFLVELLIRHRPGLNRSMRHNQCALQPLCPDIDHKKPMVRVHHCTMPWRNFGFLEVTELCTDPKLTTTCTTDCRSGSPHSATPPRNLSFLEGQQKKTSLSLSCYASITRLSTLSAAGSRVPAKVWTLKETRERERGTHNGNCAEGSNPQAFDATTASGKREPSHAG